MALTLSGELQDAQDYQHRNPRIRITSDQYEAAIPMDGRYWSNTTSGEHLPEVILHSTGRWVGVYSEDGYEQGPIFYRNVWGQYLNFFTSDEDQKYWNVEHQLVDSTIDWRIRDQSLVEVHDENIGIVWLETRDYVTGTDYCKINCMVVNIEGTIITGELNITTVDQADYYINSVHIGKLGSGETYFLSYGHHDVDADNWNIRYRTSSDFANWSGPQNLPLSFSGEIDSHEKDNPFLVNPPNHNPILFFDYVDGISPSGTSEVINLYKVETTDDGATWTSGERLTENVPYGRASEFPSAALTSGEQIRLAYHDEISVLHMYEKDVGWCLSTTDDAGSMCASHSTSVQGIHFDPYERKLWVVNHSRVNSQVCSIVGINVDDWEVDKCYCDTSTPAIPEEFSNNAGNPRGSLTHGKVMHNNDPASHWVHASTVAGHVVVINTKTDEVIELVSAGPGGYYAPYDICKCSYMVYPYVYTLHTYNAFCDNIIWIYRCNLADDVPQFDEISSINLDGYFSTTRYFSEATQTWVDVPLSIKLDVQGMCSCISHMKVHPEIATITIHSNTAGNYNVQTGANYTGALMILGMAGEGSGWSILSVLARVRDFKGNVVCEHVVGNNIPLKGPRDSVYMNGAWHCTFDDDATKTGYWHYDPSAWNGVTHNDIGDLELVDRFGTSTYIEPDNASRTTYDFDWVYATEDQKLIFTTVNNTGVWIYNTVDDNNSRTTSWHTYDNDTMPGFTPDGSDTFGSWNTIAYDPLYQTVYTGRGWTATYEFNGVIAFNINGPFAQMKYKTGSFNTDWTFTGATNLTVQLFDQSGSIGVDSEDTMWLWWIRGDLSIGEYKRSLKWDKGKNYVDLTPWLVGETSITWELDQPNTLEFTLSEGHLFDTHNNRSIYAMYTERGKKFSCEFGEYFSSGEYTIYQDQGSFILEELSINYHRGQHPTASVVCRDKRSQWLVGTEQITDHFSGEDPIYVLGNILENQGHLTSAQYDLPSSMEHEHPIYYRWIDTNLNDIITELLDHFRYAQLQNVEDKFTIKYIDFEPETVDHEYPDNTKLIDYSPDDQWSVYTNRVVVRGETRDEIEVIYPREFVCSQFGTLGWWGQSDTNRHYYSSDHEKLMQHATVDVTHPPSFNDLFLMAGGGGKVRMRYGEADVPSTYCEVEVKVPNLVAVIIAEVAAVSILVSTVWGCDAEPPFKPGWCAVYISALGISVMFLANSLGAVANYQYEVYANPVGYVKQTFQAEANDWDSQIKLDGKIITETIDDPFCYEQSQAKMVAEKTLEFFKYQRWGQRITKVADLRDELLDTIRLNHPFSYDKYRILINSLTRRYQPSKAGESEGYFIDEIGGWNLDMIRTDVALDP